MTTTYHLHDPEYLDEADVRDELTRVFDVCHGCQRCVERCSTFPTMFSLIDRHPDRAADRLTPADQDRVVDRCFQCTMCVVDCPYTPELHPLAVDVPRLVERATAMRRANGQFGARRRTATSALGRTDRTGRWAVRWSSLANRVLAGPPGSAARRLVRLTTGVTSARLLPSFARQRFSMWFAKRPRVRLAHRQESVAIFPTCFVEYMEPAIGHDLVKVYERNGIECRLAADVGCCGAPLLHGGQSAQFATVAATRVAALAESVRAGLDIVVPQPTCGYVLRRDYPLAVPGADAELVAAHTYDAVEYLMRVHRGDETSLDLDFHGEIPAAVTYHVPSYLTAQRIGLHGRDLLKLTGTRVRLVHHPSGVDALWGWQAANDAISTAVGAELGEAVRCAAHDAAHDAGLDPAHDAGLDAGFDAGLDGGPEAGIGTVVGDCHLANTVIAEQTAAVPVHPLQLLARAYGIAEEPSDQR